MYVYIYTYIYVYLFIHTYTCKVIHILQWGYLVVYCKHALRRVDLCVLAVILSMCVFSDPCLPAIVIRCGSFASDVGTKAYPPTVTSTSPCSSLLTFCVPTSISTLCLSRHVRDDVSLCVLGMLRAAPCVPVPLPACHSACLLNPGNVVISLSLSLSLSHSLSLSLSLSFSVSLSLSLSLFQSLIA